MSSSSAAAAQEPHVVEDCRGVLQLMSDGTVRRSAEPAALFPAVDMPDDDDCGVEWKDVTWDGQHDLNARLYRPRHLGAANDARIPVVAYFHGGGGFCIGSGRWPSFHAWCLRLSSELPAVVLSFDYRLAPEHRLPAAQEDGARAMSWLRSDADPWLADAADFARVFVAGDSAGGNIAHHVAAGLGKTGLGPAPSGSAAQSSSRRPSPARRARGRSLSAPATATRSSPPRCGTGTLASRCRRAPRETTR